MLKLKMKLPRLTEAEKKVLSLFQCGVFSIKNLITDGTFCDGVDCISCPVDKECEKNCKPGGNLFTTDKYIPYLKISHPEEFI